MIKFILTSSWRNITKNRAFSILNIIGLTVGISSFLIIIQYIRHESNFDSFHINKDNIYRVESQFYLNNVLTDNWATSSYGYATAMYQEFPEIEDFARVNLYEAERVVRYNEIKYRESKVYFADSSFFRMFSFPFLEGNPLMALKGPNKVVISASMAKKYFGNENPLGKILSFQNFNYNHSCEVTGIFKDVPDDSHLKFDMLISWQTSPHWMENFWYMHEAYTYIKVKPASDIKAIEARFPEMAERYKTSDALRAHKWAIKLVPLCDIHLNPAKGYELEIKGNRSSLYFLLLFAVLIIVIAWINYTNHTTARALEKTKETGVKKTLGSSGYEMFLQSVFDSFLYNLLSVIFSILLLIIIKPLFEKIITSEILIFGDSFFWLIVISLLCVGSVIPGLYPAFFLSRFKPAETLKGKYMATGNGSRVRSVLVISQFAASIIFLVFTMTVFLQIRYMRSSNPGINLKQTMVLKVPAGSNDFFSRINTFKNEITKMGEVKGASVSSAVPGKEVGKNITNRPFHGNASDDRLYEMCRIDQDFINMFNIEIIAGRSFDINYPTDSFSLMVNETAAKLLGYSNAKDVIGQSVILENSRSGIPVIGVVKDYNHLSLKELPRPTMFFIDAYQGWITPNFLSVKVETTNMTNLVSMIRKQWDELFPGFPMDFFFLDDFYNKQYQSDQQLGETYIIFSLIAVFISCLGLFGLTLLTINQKRKEIGVRKVIGATVNHILIKFTSDIIRLICISMIIAIPVSYIIINHWLNSFAYKIVPEWWIFVLAGLSIMVIALLTISLRTYKAAVQNPVKALRYE